MDFRRIIKFGKSSYVISLPKNWLEKNNLAKGDIVYVSEKNKDLLLLPKRTTRRKILKSIEIDVSNLSVRDIERRIISAYIQNYNMIHLFGKDFKSKVKFIKDCIQNIMALEIMEETSEKLVAKDFLKMEEINLTDIVRRIDVITRAMFLDVIEKNHHVDNIYERDQDVNRLTFLMYRSIRFYMDNPVDASKRNLDLHDLLLLNNIAKSLERIADDVKRIAKLVNKTSLPKKSEDDIYALLTQVYNHYICMMKAYYKDDKDKALELANGKHELINEARRIYEDVWNIRWASVILEKIKDSVDSIHSFGRSMYH